MFTKSAELYDTIYSTLELMRAFRDAGLDADHDPKGLSDRGLFVAWVAA